MDFPELPSDMNGILRILFGIALVILLIFLITSHAEVILILGVLAVIVFFLVSSAKNPGTLAKATAKRKGAVSANPQPTLQNLIRTSSEIGAGRAVTIGKISGMVKIRDTNTLETKGKTEDALYEITVQEGPLWDKRQILFLVRKSDLLLTDTKTPINGNVTVKCSGFVPAGMHLVPDTWGQNEVNKIEYAITRTFVSQSVADDVLEDSSATVSLAKKSDPRHEKKLEEIDRGVSNPGT